MLYLPENLKKYGNLKNLTQEEDMVRALPLSPDSIL